MTMPRLSVVVITLNEEDRLRETLARVAWADEIVVVDAGSEDKTVALAREFTDHVLIHPWQGFAAQKNVGIAHATGDWILSLDADEHVEPALREEITAVLQAPDARDGYRIARRNIMWGRWIRHGRLYPDWQLRLFRRGRGRFVERAVHESVQVDGTIGRLAAPLLHHSYRDVSDFLRRADRYSTLAAEEWTRAGRPFCATQLLTAPLGRFLSMYVVHRGFLDGWRGFLLAVLYAYYVFIRSAKIWEKVKQA
ncbi:MAG TPA: glycosyltransferase family 2 protein [Methylomirabilota bacterium]|jgi:glycosyltransferase involved in cell wall biosynthesis|nr:glycosyltransferase family 2 protein [Methylomirabilota bacterium]